MGLGKAYEIVGREESQPSREDELLQPESLGVVTQAAKGYTTQVSFSSLELLPVCNQIH